MKQYDINYSASKYDRFFDFIIDIVFLRIAVTIIWRLMKAHTLLVNAQIDDATIKSIWYGFQFTIYFLYYYTFEAMNGRTLGKLVTDTRVVNNKGFETSTKEIALRTIFRFIPFEGLSFFGRIGWHDKFSKTLVIRNSSPVINSEGSRSE